MLYTRERCTRQCLHLRCSLEWPECTKTDKPLLPKPSPSPSTNLVSMLTSQKWQNHKQGFASRKKPLLETTLLPLRLHGCPRSQVSIYLFTLLRTPDAATHVCHTMCSWTMAEKKELWPKSFVIEKPSVCTSPLLISFYPNPTIPV